MLREGRAETGKLLTINNCIHKHTEKRQKRNLKSNVQSGMFKHTFTPTLRRMKQMELFEFKASLVSLASSRPETDTQ